MFEITGVQFGKRRLPFALQEQIRSAMKQCLQCSEEEECKVWLETAEYGVEPPEFCQLRTAITQMKALANSYEP